MDPVITDQAGMDSLFASVVADFNGIRYQPVLERGLRMFAEDHRQMFAMQREPNDGPAWKPLAPSTVKRKGHDTILVETGRLKGSLTDERHSDGIREIFDNGLGGAGLVFGTDVPYAHFHMTGTSRMPARPEVGAHEKTVDRFGVAVADHIVAELVQ